MSSEIHRETLEEEATHVLEEARMMLPGVQAILGFQLIAAFNERFTQFERPEQILHFIAFLLVALAMGLVMAPAAYHRQAERGVVSRRFVVLASALLTFAMPPFIVGICLDAYLVGLLVLSDRIAGVIAAGILFIVLTGLWFAMPALAGRRNRRV
jgi:hypothetical protein